MPQADKNNFLTRGLTSGLRTVYPRLLSPTSSQILITHCDDGPPTVTIAARVPDISRTNEQASLSQRHMRNVLVSRMRAI